MQSKSINAAAITMTIVIILSIQIAGAEDFYLQKLEKKNGAILLILDGAGASYLSTYNYIPYDLNGVPLRKAGTPNLSLIAGKGIVVQDVRALLPTTQRGHSIIATGYSNADLEIIGYSDASIYDILRKNGYVCLALLEKGDFEEVIKEQDIAIHDPSNSVDNPVALLKKNSDVKPDLESFMLSLTEKLPGYMEGEKGAEKYARYNKWALDSLNSIADYFAEHYPDKKFFLTVNAGGADLAGHNFDEERYTEVIEKLDEGLPQLFETCIRKNLSLIITSDHGMKFSTANSKGGHSSEKYSDTPESQRIPLIIYSPGIESKAVLDVREQKDIAPTILSLLDIVDRPIYCDGRAIQIRSYVNLKIESSDDLSDIRVSRGETLVGRTAAKNATFYGLDAGNYTVHVDEKVREVDLKSDDVLYFSKMKVEPVYRNNQFLAGGVILSIITTGLLMIRRILKR